jgi:hypothetical protein
VKSTSEDFPSYDLPLSRVLRQPDAKKRLAHQDVSTAMIYTHVLNKGGRCVRSALDAA